MLLSLHAGRWDKDKLFCNIIIFHFRLSPETPLQKGISVSVAAIVRKCQLRVHTSRGFIYWLLGEQHCKRSGCTRDEQGGERGERTKGYKVWSEKSSTESTKIMQPYMLYVYVRGSNVPAAQNLFPLSTISSHTGNTHLSVTAIWNMVPLQSIALGIQSQEHVPHFHIHLHH